MDSYRFSVIAVAVTALAIAAIGCKKAPNEAPEVPSVPAGPGSGSRNSQIVFSSSAEDPDGDSVAIRFDWDDGDTSNWSPWAASGDTISMAHSWSDSGTYLIRAQARDTKDGTSDWSIGHQMAIGGQNEPPDAPSAPYGPETGSVGTEYAFVSTAADPDGDSVAIRFDWGDGDTSNWSSWAASGDTISMEHSWSDSGTYLIRAQARDTKDGTSGWSIGHPMAISADGSGGWDTTFGGAGADRGFSVQQTTDGGYIIAGLTNRGGEDQLYLVKTDASGSLEWEKSIDSARITATQELEPTDTGFCVQQTTDRGYIVASHFCATPRGGLLKTNANGDITWAAYVVTWAGCATSVQQTADGGYILAGYCIDDFVALSKFGWDGTSQWDYGIIHSGRGNRWSVRQTGDGAYIMAGSAEGGLGKQDVFLVKRDVLGNLLWSVPFGGPENDYGHSVQLTSDGGYIIVGFTQSFGAGGSDVFLIKTNYAGMTIWTKTFGGSADDHGFSVQQTQDGGYIIAGETGSYGNSSQVYLIKTDGSGDTLWTRTFGGPNWELANSVQQTEDGGYIVVGTTWSYGAGQGDVYLIKTDANGNVEQQSTAIPPESRPRY